MKLLEKCKLLFLALPLVASGCPWDKNPPPPLTICYGDGFGGCDGVDKHGDEIHKAPSELDQTWVMHPVTEFAAYAAYCQGVSPQEVNAYLDLARFEPKTAGALMRQLEQRHASQ